MECICQQAWKESQAFIIDTLWARAASIIILVTAGVLFINRLSHRDAGETSGRVARETGSKPSEDGITKADTATSIPVTTAVTPGKNEASAANNEAITDTGAKEPVIEATVPVIVSQGGHRLWHPE